MISIGIPELVVVLVIIGLIIFGFVKRHGFRRKEVIVNNFKQEVVHEDLDCIGDHAFFEAIKNGDINTVREYLNKGFDPNAIDNAGNPALLYAATLGNISMVEVLLEKGADSNKHSANGFSPLHFAVFNNHVATVRLLLHHAAKVDPCNPSGYTSLYDAAAEGHLEMTRLLLKHGADVSARGGDNSTALHAAAFNGHTEISELLVDSGAHAFTKNNQGVTALTAAGVKKHADIMRIFVSKGMFESLTLNNSAAPDMSREVRSLCLEAAMLRQNWDKEGNLKQAEELYREAVKLFPNCWVAHFGLGEVLSVRVNNEHIIAGPIVDETVSELKEACKLAPDRREPHLKLAAEYVKMNPNAAEMVFRKAIDQCDNGKGCVYPLVWQAGDYWSIAVSAAESHELMSLALEAFCRAIYLKPYNYGGYVKPSSSVATAVWNTALQLLPDDELPTFKEPNILGPDLSAAIDKASEQMQKITKLHNTSLTYFEMFTNTPNPDYLQEALLMEKQAWEIAPDDFPERYKIASHYGVMLQTKFDLTKEPDDLNQSVDLLNFTVSHADNTDPKKPDYLDNLSIAFNRLFDYDGDRENLKQSIELIKQAISLTPAESPSMPRYLSNLGVKYLTLYKITTAISDLRKAMTILDQALDKDLDSPDLPMVYTHRGIVRRNLFVRIDEPAELDKAIEDFQEAIRNTPKAPKYTIDFAIRLNNLGNALRDRFRVSLNDTDLDQSIECFEKSLDIEATPGRQANYAIALLDRHLARGSLRDLDQSIAILEKVVEKCSQQSPDYALYLLNLGQALHQRHQQTEKDEDLKHAISCFKRAVDLGSKLPVHTSLIAAKAWLASACQRKLWSEATQAYVRAIGIRERILETQVLREDKYSWLRETQGLAAQGAYAFFKENMLREAVVAIEQGLARLLSESLSRERLNLERLRKSGQKELYGRYQQHIDRWSQIVNQEHHGASFEEDLRKIQEGLHKTIVEIRHVRGFEHFFLLPDFEDIAIAARMNPIVYLIAADEGGLALAVGVQEQDARRCGYGYINGVCSIPLPNLTNEEVNRLLGDPHAPEQTGCYLGTYNELMKVYRDIEQWKAALNQTTEWLWSAVMSRIVRLFSLDTQVTLIPVGRLSLLPFHAAWTEDSSRVCGRWYALDHLVISYAPNAQSLIAASNLANQLKGDKCLGINEPDKNHPLPNSHKEVMAICSLFTRCTMLRRGKATKEAVLRELHTHDLAHFSCHGKAHLHDPLKSKLMMTHGEPITLEDLIRLRLKGLRLVSLSACESGMSGVTLPDEFLSLPSGLMEANVAGIVSSLWSVPERSTMLLMVRFYELWKQKVEPKVKLTPAQALRDAQKWVRDSSPNEKEALINRSDQIVLAYDTECVEVDSQPRYRASNEKLDFAHPFYWGAFIHVGV